MSETTEAMCASMASDFQAAFLNASAQVTTHANIVKAGHVLQRMTSGGEPCERVYLACMHIRSAPDLEYWRFAIMHPRHGEIENELVPVSEWTSAQHAVAISFRRKILQAVRGCREEVDTDAVVFTGPVTKRS